MRDYATIYVGTGTAKNFYLNSHSNFLKTNKPIRTH